MRLDEAIAHLIARKREANLRPKSITELSRYLAAFARGREGTVIASFAVEDLESWEAGRKDALSTKASNRGRLRSLFSFAMRRGWIERNPCERLEPIRLERKAPTILTPLQAALLMDWVKRRKPHQAAWFALALFAGIRPDELSRLTWDAVSIDRGFVRIDAAASKVRRRRLVYLEPNCIEWLKFAKEHNARLPVCQMTRRRYLDYAEGVLSLESWPQDCLRHSAASYGLALHRDAGKIAMNLGNSVGILERHYKEIVEPDQCTEFWAITPTSPRPEKPVPVPAVIDPVTIPSTWSVTIDPSWPRFARAEVALQVEPILRALGRQKQKVAGYHGGVTGRRMESEDRIDTIGELGRIAFCSRQTMQWCKHIIHRADPDVLDALRKGKRSISGVYKQITAEVA